VIIQLNPPILLETPLGEAFAYFLESEGQQIWYGVFVKNTGENWWFLNDQVRLVPCYSDKHYTTSPIDIPEVFKERRE